MLENSFSKSVLQQLRVGPLAPYLNAYTALLSDQGYKKFSLKYKIRLIAKFNHWLHQQHFDVNELTEEVFNNFFKYQRIPNPVRRGHSATLRSLLQYLHAQGAISSGIIEIEDNPFHRIEHEFARYLSQERGLSTATLDNYIPLVRRFLFDCFKTDTIKFDELRPTDIITFILRYSQTVKRKTAKLMTTSLRAFFRYLRWRGEIIADLAEFVPTVSDWRLSNLPKSIEPKKIQSLLKSCDQSSKVGKRDYTILLLLARLGLRAGEVVAMTLDDINWEAGELIIRGKGSRRDRLPIPCDVGEALATYLQHIRPCCSTRRIFIRIRAPYQGFSSSVAVCNIVQRALLRAKIQTDHKGAHLFRHSLATHMLHKGASLTEIGQVLRHQSANTTEIYTKVDIRSLRSIALPWLGGEI